MKRADVERLIAQAIQRERMQLHGEVAPAIAAALRSHGDRPAGEKGSPSIQFGIVTDVFSDQGYASVQLDGQGDSTPHMILAPVAIGTRVAVVFYPPSGSLVISEVAPTGGGPGGTGGGLLPPGGATAYVLTKNSPADFDALWLPDTDSGGGGGGSVTLASGFYYDGATETTVGSGLGGVLIGWPAFNSGTDLMSGLVAGDTAPGVAADGLYTIDVTFLAGGLGFAAGNGLELAISMGGETLVGSVGYEDVNGDGTRRGQMSMTKLLVAGQAIEIVVLNNTGSTVDVLNLIALSVVEATGGGGGGGGGTDGATDIYQAAQLVVAGGPTQLDWGTLIQGPGILDLSTPTAPRPLVAGTYAMNAYIYQANTGYYQMQLVMDSGGSTVGPQDVSPDTGTNALGPGPYYKMNRNTQAAMLVSDAMWVSIWPLGGVDMNPCNSIISVTRMPTG